MRVKPAREEECAGFRCRNGASCEVNQSNRHVWELRNRRDLPCVRVRGSVYKEQREAFSNEETICLMERFQSCKLVRAFKTPCLDKHPSSMCKYIQKRCPYPFSTCLQQLQVVEERVKDSDFSLMLGRLAGAFLDVR